jgi:hypothetical protein
VICDRWGVSESEVRLAYPCDEFVTGPGLQAWRGIHIEAPAGAVWPWVAQIRLAPYSFDWIDNRGRRSPRELAGLPEPQVGEGFTAVGGRATGRIVSVDPGRQLTGTIMGAYLSYVLVPQADDTTRLLLKVTARTRRWAAPALSVGDLIMARRQLLNLKLLAERHHRQASPGQSLPQIRAEPAAHGQRAPPSASGACSRTVAINCRFDGFTIARPATTTVGTVSFPSATERTNALASGSLRMSIFR